MTAAQTAEDTLHAAPTPDDHQRLEAEVERLGEQQGTRAGRRMTSHIASGRSPRCEAHPRARPIPLPGEDRPVWRRPQAGT